MDNIPTGGFLFSNWISAYDVDFFSLPEEIREGIESKKDRIHSKKDMDHLVWELKMKK